MISIAIMSDAGSRFCKNCHLKRWSYRDWECPAFQETLNVDENLGIVRLPQCLAAESDLKRLVEAARRGLHWMKPSDPDADFIREALKPFEDSPKEGEDDKN